MNRYGEDLSLVTSVKRTFVPLDDGSTSMEKDFRSMVKVRIVKLVDF